MDKPVIVIPVFYPYQFAEGEMPLDVMARWAQQASEQEMPSAGNPEAGAAGSIVESSVQPGDSPSSHKIRKD